MPFLIRGWGVRIAASVNEVRISDFCHPAVIVLLTTCRHMVIEAIWTLFICALAYRCRPYVSVGMTVTLIRCDATSGLSFLRGGARRYRIFWATAARLLIRRAGQREDWKKTPIHLCSRLL